MSNAGWGPTRPVIVMDGTKMTYFAKANMIRAGAFNTYGALQGLGDDASPWLDNSAWTGGDTSTSDTGYQSPYPDDPIQTSQMTDPGEVPTASTGAGYSALSRGSYRPESQGATNGGNTLSPNGTNTVDSFFSTLNNLFGSFTKGYQGGSQLKPYQAPPSPVPMILGGVAVLIVGAVVISKLSHRK